LTTVFDASSTAIGSGPTAVAFSSQSPNINSGVSLEGNKIVFATAGTYLLNINAIAQATSSASVFANLAFNVAFEQQHEQWLGEGHEDDLDENGDGWAKLSVIYDFNTRLAGMVPIDKSSFPLWIDKYRITQLFAEDKVLAELKPKWGNYKKMYTKKLADTIAAELGSETFVIKPRGNFMGKSVIITQRQDLDEVLHYIITKKGKLAKSENTAYKAWKNDKFDSFIVEEFVTSDPIKLPHLGNKTYLPTMRVAFLLTYNNHQHSVHFPGGYWKTPHFSLDEEGDFMDKNKDIREPPYYQAWTSKTMQAVKNALPRLHSKMLQFRPPNYTHRKEAGLQLILQETT
jgi:hypothetical protein